MQQFPAAGGEKWKVSDGGGASPVWARNGRELFFLTKEGRILSAGYHTEGNSFVAEKPRAWSQAAIPISGVWYDMMPDGKRAIVVRPGYAFY